MTPFESMEYRDQRIKGVEAVPRTDPSYLTFRQTFFEEDKCPLILHAVTTLQNEILWNGYSIEEYKVELHFVFEILCITFCNHEDL